MTDRPRRPMPTADPAARRRPEERQPRHETHPEERLLLRLLTDPRGERGDLSAAEARELRRRLDEEPGLAARFERLAAPWRTLEPPPDTLPPGFTGRVMARLADERREAPPLVAAPVRVRSLAAVALVVGLAAGPLLVERVSDTPSGLAPLEIAETLQAVWLEDSPGLAESYLQALETETDGQTETGGAAGTDSGKPDNETPKRSADGSPDPGGNL